MLISFGALLRGGSHTALEAFIAYKASNNTEEFMRSAASIVEASDDPMVMMATYTTPVFCTTNSGKPGSSAKYANEVASGSKMPPSQTKQESSKSLKREEKVPAGALGNKKQPDTFVANESHKSPQAGSDGLGKSLKNSKTSLAKKSTSLPSQDNKPENALAEGAANALEQSESKDKTLLLKENLNIVAEGAKSAKGSKEAKPDGKASWKVKTSMEAKASTKETGQQAPPSPAVVIQPNLPQQTPQRIVSQKNLLLGPSSSTKSCWGDRSDDHDSEGLFDSDLNLEKPLETQQQQGAENSASIASFIGEELETILVRITMEEGRQMGEQEEDGSVQEELEQSNPSTLTGPRIGQDLVSSLPSATSGLQMNTTQDLPLPSVPMPNMGSLGQMPLHSSTGAPVGLPSPSQHPVNPLLGGPHSFGRIVPIPSQATSNPLPAPPEVCREWREYTHNGRLYYSDGQVSVWDPPMEYIIQQQRRGLHQTPVPMGPPHAVVNRSMNTAEAPARDQEWVAHRAALDLRMDKAISCQHCPEGSGQFIAHQNESQGLENPPFRLPVQTYHGHPGHSGLYKHTPPVPVNPLNFSPPFISPMGMMPHSRPDAQVPYWHQQQQHRELLQRTAQAFGEKEVRALTEKLLREGIPQTTDDVIRYLSRHPEDLAALMGSSETGSGATADLAKKHLPEVGSHSLSAVEQVIPRTDPIKFNVAMPLPPQQNNPQTLFNAADRFEHGPSMQMGYVPPTQEVHNQQLHPVTATLQKTPGFEKALPNAFGHLSGSFSNQHVFPVPLPPKCPENIELNIPASNLDANNPLPPDSFAGQFQQAVGSNVASERESKPSLLNALRKEGEDHIPGHMFMFGDGSESLSALTTSPDKLKDRSIHPQESYAGPQGDGHDESRVHHPPGQRAEKRRTFEQVGRILLEFEDSLLNSSTVLPSKSRILALWELPKDLFNDQGQNLLIGLFHIGAPTNATPITASSIQIHQAKPIPATTGSTLTSQMFGGAIPFCMPKNAGMYVFRIYSTFALARTLAFSESVTVASQGHEAEKATRLLLQQLRSQSKGREERIVILIRLTWIVKGMKKGNSDMNYNMGEVLWKALQEGFAFIQREFDHALENRKRRAEGASDPHQLIHEPTRTSLGLADPEYLLVRRVHIAFRDLLFACEQNSDMSWILAGSDKRPFHRTPKADASAHILGDPLDNIQKWQLLWCPVYELYFPSEEVLVCHFKEDLGFCPALSQQQALNLTKVDASFCLKALSSEMMDFRIFDILTEDIKNLLPSIVPSDQFYVTREHIRACLERVLLASPFIPKGTSLAVFGSSSNSFGSHWSGLDMCFVLANNHINQEEGNSILLQTAGLLKDIGMRSVECRRAARSPAVVFLEPNSGVECTISMYDPLALANTALLATYSRIDARVRALAYAVQYWAQQRGLNTPKQMGLSSYGFLLAIIHFLQTRPNPILPNLQELPSSWGERLDGYGKEEFTNKSAVPVVLTQHISMQRPCNTYFYVPRNNDYTLLASLARLNTESVGELLFGFFRYFATEFDHHHRVISIRTRSTLPKEIKAEQECWPLHTRLSIEDPFEIWNDVCHKVKAANHQRIHAECHRALSMMLESNLAVMSGTRPDALWGLFQRVCLPLETSTPPCLRFNDGFLHGNEEPDDDATIIYLLEVASEEF